MEKQKLFSEIPCLKGESITIKKLTPECADGLRMLTQDNDVYRFLPKTLFEKKYDTDYVIAHLYDECLKESLILGVFSQGEFAGLAEIYGCSETLAKASIGIRLLRKYRSKGVAAQASKMLIDYLFNEAGIKAITASAMPENKASEKVLKKLGFKLVSENEYEDWGFENLTLADKWILKK